MSLNKCFQKVPRRKDEPGKGGFWRINPEYSDMLVDGVLKKRRTCTRENYMLPVKRIKCEPEDDGYNTSCSSNERPKSNEEKVNEQRSLVGEGVSPHDLMNGNYSWNELLNQDIMVGGVTVKTEDIIDDNVTCLEEQNEESAFIGASPTSSSIDNSDSSLDDFWNMDFTTDSNNQDVPLDLSTSGFALDLTIQGVGLRAPPNWWEAAPAGPAKNDSGMHTPVHESDSLDHPWSESRLSVEDAIAAFDIDNLFDADVPSPTL